MSNLLKKSDEIINIPLHKNARELIRLNIDDYGSLLIIESKLEAVKNGSDEVQSNHVKNATENIGKNKKKWIYEFFKIIGGTLFGGFFPGFITSITNSNIPLLITYTGLGFLGLMLIFIGLTERKLY